MLAPFALCGMCLSTIRPFKSVVGNHQRVPGLPILPIQQQWRALPRVGARACSSDEELLPLVVCIGQLNQPRPYQHRDHQGAPFENGRSEQGRIDAPGGPQLRQSVVQKVRILPRHSRPPQTTSSPFTNIKPGTREIAVFSTRAGVRLDHAEPTPASGRPATLPLACGTPSSSVPAGSAQLPPQPRAQSRVPVHRPAFPHYLPVRGPPVVHPIPVAAVQLSRRQPTVQSQKRRLPTTAHRKVGPPPSVRLLHHRGPNPPGTPFPPTPTAHVSPQLVSSSE